MDDWLIVSFAIKLNMMTNSELLASLHKRFGIGSNKSKQLLLVRLFKQIIILPRKTIVVIMMMIVITLTMIRKKRFMNILQANQSQ